MYWIILYMNLATIWDPAFVDESLAAKKNTIVTTLHCEKIIVNLYACVDDAH